MEVFKSKYSTCVGPSMYPTLQPGDGITSKLYKGPEEMKVGDVIVYPHPNGSVDVVHRIIQIKPEGVITRGDNNNKTDHYILPFKDVTGKVVSAKRRNRLNAIHGGKAGFCIHKLMLFRKYTMPFVILPFRTISNMLTASGLFLVFHPLLSLRIVNIQRNKERNRILVSGNRVVGRQLSDSGKWQIRFPFKLFVNTRLLEKKE